MSYQPPLLQPRPEAGVRVYDDHQRWLDWLAGSFPPPTLNLSAPRVIDLFAGCGGLGLGFEAAGFTTHGYEMKAAAAETYRSNLPGGCSEVKLQVGEPTGEADLVVGGPPCQPFSQIGYQRGERDPRDGFPVFLDTVARLRPRLALIENVRGLLFRNKDYLVAACRELERFGYRVDVRLLNASDYGTPQNRERVVVLATRGSWEWPERVVESPVTAGVALGTLALQVPTGARFLTPAMDRYIEEYERRSHCINPRDLHLDRPARTLTCRNFAAATSDMQRIRLPDGRRRMLTLREGARLQGFPDWFAFSGTFAEQTEQIGNAVSPLMALALARQAMRALESPLAKPPKSPTFGGETRSAHEETPREVKVRQAITLLSDAGLALRDFTPLRRERIAMALLAVAGLRPNDPWSDAASFLEDHASKTPSQREILHFWNDHYGTKLADSSYDDVKRRALVHLEAHHLVEAGVTSRASAQSALAFGDTAAINDGTRGHALTLEGLALLRAYGGEGWSEALATFRAAVPNAAAAAAERRRRTAVPIALPGGESLELSAGDHNRLQEAVVRDFLGRFVPDATVLYIADAASRRAEGANLREFKDEARMATLGLPSLR